MNITNSKPITYCKKAGKSVEIYYNYTSINKALLKN